MLEKLACLSLSEFPGVGSSRVAFNLQIGDDFFALLNRFSEFDLSFSLMLPYSKRIGNDDARDTFITSVKYV